MFPNATLAASHTPAWAACDRSAPTSSGTAPASKQDGRLASQEAIIMKALDPASATVASAAPAAMSADTLDEVMAAVGST